MDGGFIHKGSAPVLSNGSIVLSPSLESSISNSFGPVEDPPGSSTGPS
jgi:hypothetical protein